MSLPYFNLYPTDFEAKTSHLTLEEDGAYNRLLRLCWMMPGASLPDDDAWIMRRMRVDEATFNRVVKVVLAEFFTRKSGRVSNARMAREYASSSAAHQKRVLSGKAGGTAKALKTNKSEPSNARAMLKQPEPEPEIEKEEGKPSSKKIRASRLAVDWFLPQQWGEWAISEGCPVDVIRSEAEKFKDYWHSKAGPTASKLDWQATWRNWIRQAIERTPKFNAIAGGRYEPSTSNNFGSATGRGDRLDPALEQIARLTGLSPASGNDSLRVGGFGEKDGPIWMGARPQ